MSFSVQLGLLLSVATALTSIVGFLYKHRGAVLAPDVDFRRPIRSSLVLFKSGWYVLGIAVATASWVLHVGALALAPISLVQSIIAGGLVLLTVVADRLFGIRVSRREWIGVALAALGLAFLAATLEGAASEAHSDYDGATIAAYMGLALLAGLVLTATAGRRPQAGVLFGAAAGLCWGASDIAIKGASDSLDQGIAVLTDPLVAVIIGGSAIGLLVSAKSLQVGDPVPVIAVTAVAANTVTIASGPIVFGDPLPSDPLGLAARLLAFVLVIAAAALTPAPIEAAGVEGEDGPGSRQPVEPQPAPAGGSG